jgi:hypothetical protein
MVIGCEYVTWDFEFADGPEFLYKIGPYERLTKGFCFMEFFGWVKCRQIILERT